MSQEENIKQNLTNRFSYLADKIRIQRPRRIYLEVALENFMQVLEYVMKELRFSHLCAITGLDEEDRLSFIYHLSSDTGVVLNIKISAPKDNPVIKTVTQYFPSAEIYERELVDLLGAKIEGLPAAGRYPLTDDWPAGQFPLRKDWKKDV